MVCGSRKYHSMANLGIRFVWEVGEKRRGHWYPLPSPSSKFIYVSGPFPSKDMHNAYLLFPLRIASFFIRDAHSVESNEISIFRFFAIFIFWVMADSIDNLLKLYRSKKQVVQKSSNLQEICALLLNDCMSLFYVTFSLWDMVYFNV